MIYRPKTWLFPAKSGEGPYCLTNLQKAFRAVVRQGGIGKHASVHTLRHLFENLKKLATGRFGDHDPGGALERELYHLRDIGYIAVHSVKEIPKDGPDLSTCVSITEAGRKFVRLREEIVGR